MLVRAFFNCGVSIILNVSADPVVCNINYKTNGGTTHEPFHAFETGLSVGKCRKCRDTFSADGGGLIS